jgi:hypothetical protein
MGNVVRHAPIGAAIAESSVPRHPVAFIAFFSTLVTDFVADLLADRLADNRVRCGRRSLAASQLSGLAAAPGQK